MTVVKYYMSCWPWTQSTRSRVDPLHRQRPNCTICTQPCPQGQLRCAREKWGLAACRNPPLDAPYWALHALRDRSAGTPASLSCRNESPGVRRANDRTAVAGRTPYPLRDHFRRPPSSRCLRHKPAACCGPSHCRHFVPPCLARLSCADPDARSRQASGRRSASADADRLDHDANASRRNSDPHASFVAHACSSLELGLNSRVRGPPIEEQGGTLGLHDPSESRTRRPIPCHRDRPSFVEQDTRTFVPSSSLYMRAPGRAQPHM